MATAPTLDGPRYRWRLLRAASFKLDGGSMFGLVPRVVWSRAVQTDDRGRILLQHNCLLLERADANGPPGPRLVLLETGTGDKLDAKSRDNFALEPRSVLDALHEADCRPEDIDVVVPSHLHFDHAGGLTRRPRAGERPDWSPDAADPRYKGFEPVKLSFPKATVVTQAREWADAIANRSVMTRTYFPDHLDVFAPGQAGAGLLRLVDAPRPWPVGFTPDRDALPSAPVELRTREVAPGVGVFLVPGHTWGQQATIFTDDRGRRVVFVPDVMPTAAHVGAAYSLAYDVEPYTSMISRHGLLADAADRDWVLVLDHEPGHPAFSARRTDRGWFELVPEALGDH